MSSLFKTKHDLAKEGAYFVATNPTPSTGIAYGSGGTQATFVDTVNFWVFQNTAPASSALKCYFDYAKLLVRGTVPASATMIEYLVKKDQKDRYPTAGTTVEMTNVANIKGIDKVNPKLKGFYTSGAVGTIPASGPNAKTVGRGQLKPSAPVTLDKYTLCFGSQEGSQLHGLGGAVGSFGDFCPPVILDPQEWCVIHLWMISGATNPLTYEFEFCWFEA